jgi:hypothetical protein
MDIYRSLYLSISIDIPGSSGGRNGPLRLILVTHSHDAVNFDGTPNIGGVG